MKAAHLTKTAQNTSGIHSNLCLNSGSEKLIYGLIRFRGTALFNLYPQTFELTIAAQNRSETQSNRTTVNYISLCRLILLNVFAPLIFGIAASNSKRVRFIRFLFVIFEIVVALCMHLSYAGLIPCPRSSAECPQGSQFWNSFWKVIDQRASSVKIEE
jgi:hypothetical protein